jgi:hypothetical protein
MNINMRLIVPVPSSKSPAIYFRKAGAFTPSGYNNPLITGLQLPYQPNHGYSHLLDGYDLS